ncbi:hypothetical protein P153DRAFT_6847 [Dothidotthia symphoricarpi CBS 119687]|uniref:Uncharacterized protein n=1 Tax=Dothidotthia symphoricarpi CBS 119687 TaxID=1392245 RepID=A0A6A6ARU2_9PLEO|nr:uncharacterized protein P153DRAFT_6847 [Dothidotthia symphoricarpi CBS 119687]KAF2134649.1 hypothetical protein P153DRAFT_6847 [Dothidotthia symphoricarpi CBS 119687]
MAFISSRFRLTIPVTALISSDIVISALLSPPTSMPDATSPTIEIVDAPSACEDALTEKLATTPAFLPDDPMELLSDALVRDFAYVITSPRYRGDHSPANNPDHDHDPLGSPQAKEAAMERMEKSYAAYMGGRESPKPQVQEGWTRYLPWKKLERSG